MLLHDVKYLLFEAVHCIVGLNVNGREEINKKPVRPKEESAVCRQDFSAVE